MRECYAMQILDTEINKKAKEQWSQRIAMKHKVPKKDSIRLSLLHPKLFRCTTSIGVLIHMGMITNSWIGIKV